MYKIPDKCNKNKLRYLAVMSYGLRCSVQKSSLLTTVDQNTTLISWDVQDYLGVERDTSRIMHEK